MSVNFEEEIEKETETKFDKFVKGLIEFPFVRISLFCAIAGTIFYLLGVISEVTVVGIEGGTFHSCLQEMGIISKVLYYIIPLAIIARIASICLGFPTHFLSRFSAMCIFVIAEIEVINIFLRSLIEIEGTVGEAALSVCLIVEKIVWVIMVLTAISFLIRIFVALFFN